jgi:tRNA(fMet)-specific endonuclease VapC
VKYFLDSDICIFALRNASTALIARLKQQSPDNIKIPSVVEAELLYGARKSAQAQHALDKTTRLLAPYQKIPFDSSCTPHYAKIRADLEAEGKVIGGNDLLIAAIVLTHNGVLVTNNVKEFQRIANLSVENWI